jgi:hypothetical protein
MARVSTFEYLMSSAHPERALVLRLLASTQGGRIRVLYFDTKVVCIDETQRSEVVRCVVTSVLIVADMAMCSAGSAVVPIYTRS